MTEGALGRVYQDGEVIISQGEVGNCMYLSLIHISEPTRPY